MLHTVALLVALAAPGAEGPPAGSSEMDVRAFVQILDRLASDAERASPADVTRLLTILPTSVRVRHAEQQFTVNLEPIAQSLAEARAAGDDARLRARLLVVHTQLARMKAEAEALLDERSRDPVPGLHERLTAVLSRPEFSRANTPTSWRTLLRRRIDAWLRALFGGLGTGTGNRSIPQMIAWLITLAALAGASLWIYRTSRRAPGGGVEAPAADHAHMPAQRWAMRALAAARAGEAAEAIRCAYRAAITRLEDQGVWHADDARTAREYLRLLPQQDRRRDVFRDLARQFELVFYASRPPGAEDLSRLPHHLETLGCVGPRDRAI